MRSCGCTNGFVAVINERTGEVRGETACPACRPRDAALVRACEELTEKRLPICYEHGTWTREVA